MMNIIKQSVVSLTAVTLLGISLPSSATLITGDTARLEFEDFQTRLGDNFQDFQSFNPLTHLTTQVPGVTLRTPFWRSGFNSGEFPVAAGTGVNAICPEAPFSSGGCASGRRLIQGVRNGNITEGQSPYEIIFDTPQIRAGLLRSWNTFSLTSFYAGNTLLATHQNTTNTEFVGFIADTASITRIVIDGLSEVIPNRGGVFQVGNSDDLFFGNTVDPLIDNGSVPEPQTLILMLLGLVGLRMRVRKLS